MEKHDINRFITGIELFKGLNEEETAIVAASMEERRYKAGDYIFRESENREAIYLIYEGEVELLKKSPFGAEAKLSYFSRFDFLGEGSLTEEIPSKV